MIDIWKTVKLFRNEHIWEAMNLISSKMAYMEEIWIFTFPTKNFFYSMCGSVSSRFFNCKTSRETDF